MSAIRVEDLKKALDELNTSFARPGMDPLKVSEFCDLHNPSESWPDAGKPGVYALFNGDKELRYLGKASCNTCLGYRIRAHFDKHGMPKADWAQGLQFLATICVPSDRAFEAPAVEEFLINRLNPPLCGIGRSSPREIAESNGEVMLDCGASR